VEFMQRWIMYVCFQDSEKRICIATSFHLSNKIIIVSDKLTAAFQSTISPSRSVCSSETSGTYTAVATMAKVANVAIAKIRVD